MPPQGIAGHDVVHGGLAVVVGAAAPQSVRRPRPADVAGDGRRVRRVGLHAAAGPFEMSISGKL